MTNEPRKLSGRTAATGPDSLTRHSTRDKYSLSPIPLHALSESAIFFAFFSEKAALLSLSRGRKRVLDTTFRTLPQGLRFSSRFAINIVI